MSESASAERSAPARQKPGDDDGSFTRRRADVDTEGHAFGRGRYAGRVSAIPQAGPPRGDEMLQAANARMEKQAAPGAAMRERAMTARGSTKGVRNAQKVVAGVDAAREAMEHPVLKAGNTIASTLTGVDALESASHLGNVAKIGALKTIYSDPQRKGNYAEARAADEDASDTMHSAIGDFRDESDPKIRKRLARNAFKSMGHKVAKNLALGAASRAVGKQADHVPEWKMKHTARLDTSGDTDPALSRRTFGGRAAQGLRGAGSLAMSAGEVIGGASEDADTAIEEGRLGKASAITASGLTQQGAAIAATATGAGAAVTEGMDKVSMATGFAGKLLHRAGHYLARGQDQRDRQRALESGERVDRTRGQAVDWRGAVPD